MLFRRLSIFVGGWTLEAAATVCDINGDLAQNLDDVFASLIDNNLVIQSQEYKDEPRFGMLSTIQEYAYERLTECDEVDSVHDKHARYYRDFVSKVEPLIRSAERVRWQLVMQQEFGNIRAVLDWVCTTGNNIEIGQQIFTTLGVFWQLCGHLIEGQQWSAQFLTMCDDSTPTAIHAELLCWSGEFFWLQGDYHSAIEKLDESLELCNQLNDKHLIALTLIRRGMLDAVSRDLPTAHNMVQRSIELFRATKDQWYEALATAWLGWIALYENDANRASTLHSQSIKLARQQGDPWCMVPSLMSSGQIAMYDGDLTNACLIFQEAVDLLYKTGDKWSLSWVLTDLGHVAFMQGEYKQAKNCFLEVLTLASTLGNQRALLITLVGTAALIASRTIKSPDVKKKNKSVLAIAARLCGATDPYIDTPGFFVWFDTKKLYDDDIYKTKSLMDLDLWAQAYSEGQVLPLDQAIALAAQSLQEQD
jgi:tetratricopeptide (TPR) repeat protein